MLFWLTEGEKGGENAWNGKGGQTTVYSWPGRCSEFNG